MKNKLILSIILGILLVGTLAIAQLGISKDTLTIDNKLKTDLEKIGISSYYKSEVTCDEEKCRATLKNEKFNTDIKIDRYKTIVHERNETVKWTDYANGSAVEKTEIDNIVWTEQVLKTNAEIEADIKKAEESRLNQIATKLNRVETKEIVKEETEVNLR